MLFVNTESSVTQQGHFSSNGRWLVNCSLESGTGKVDLKGFTQDWTLRGKWQISTAGGELPRWHRDGKELFYRYGSTFFAVDVKTYGASFEVGIPRPDYSTPLLSATAASPEAPHTWSPRMASASSSWERWRRQPMSPSRSSSTGDSALKSLRRCRLVHQK